MREGIERFIDSLPDFDKSSTGRRALYFGYFIEEELKQTIRPVEIEKCFEAARLGIPKNVYDVIRKTPGFTKDRNQSWTLERDTRLRIKESIRGSIGTPASVSPVEAAVSDPSKSRNVMVVYGRDLRLKDDFFNLLRALDLNPIEWEEAVKKTGKGSPYVGEILDAAFGMAQAVLVLFTPDENVELRRPLASSDADFEKEKGQQSRPNVYIEAGMALGRHENRTILIEVGRCRQASDITGRHILRFSGSAEDRHTLAERLKTAGCSANTGRKDWLRIGEFKTKESPE